MSDNPLSLPICLPYLEKKSGLAEQYPDISYSLLMQLCKKTMPEIADTELNCYNLLKAARILDENTDQTKVSVLKGISCRKIQNLLDCRSLCPACPYSPSYKNGYELEEGRILSYILQDYSNYSSLIPYSLKPSFFKALFYNSSSIICIAFPLHQYLYQYLLDNYQIGMDRNRILNGFIADIDKLAGMSIPDVLKDLVKLYINTLIKNGSGSSFSAIYDLIQKASENGNQVPIDQQTKPAVVENSTKRQPETKIPPLDFMLGSDTGTEKASGNKSSKAVVPKDTNKHRSTAQLPEGGKNSDKHTRKLKSMDCIEQGIIEMKRMETRPSKTRLDAQSDELAIPETILSSIHFSMDDLRGYTYLLLTEDSITEEYEIFQSYLLSSTCVAMEGAICQEDNRCYFMLFMQERFFLFANTNLRALQQLQPILNKASNYRKIVSFDGYFLSWMLSQSGMQYIHIFSIRQAFSFHHRDTKPAYEKDPFQLVELMENKQNKQNISFYPYAMKYYEGMYRQLGHIPESSFSLFNTDRLFQLFLGASYYLPWSKEQSFQIDGRGNLSFLLPDQKVGADYSETNFKIECEMDPSLCVELILKPVLATVYPSSLFHSCHLKLLYLDHSSVKVAYLSDYRFAISEAFHMLISYFAGQNSVYIKVTEQ